MMAATKHTTLRGEMKLNEPMAKHTSWRVGGKAERFYIPADIEDLSQASHRAVTGAPCAAFGIEGPTGEQLVVAQEVNRAFLSAFDREEVTSAIQESIVLNHGVRASDVVLVQPRALPRTTSGKLRRPHARDLYLGGKLPVARRAPVGDEDKDARPRAQGGG